MRRGRAPAAGRLSIIIRIVPHALALGAGRLEPTTFVFSRGAAPLSSMEVHRAWKRDLTVARVRYRSPEQLRHTFASTMLSRECPLLYVQAQGGWRSASVLLRVYARWMPQDAASQRAATYPQPTSAPAPVTEGRTAG